MGEWQCANCFKVNPAGVPRCLNASCNLRTRPEIQLFLNDGGGRRRREPVRFGLEDRSREARLPIKKRRLRLRELLCCVA